MPPTSKDSAQDARFLAQERILDALLRALAIQEPGLLNTVRSILTDTEFSHAGKPGQEESVHHQIQSRLRLAAEFATAHGAPEA
jgi:hypothetical protein